MIEIEVQNTYSYMKNATNDAIRAVDEALAIETPGHQFTPRFRNHMWDGMTRFLRINKSSCKFPTGLLGKVTRALRSVGAIYTLREQAFDPVDVPMEITLLDSKLGTITLRDYQRKAVIEAMTFNRGIVNIATNGGKTEVGSAIIKLLLPTLKSHEHIVFFTSSKEIFFQTQARLQERLGIKIGAIGDGIWEEEQVTLVMIPTLSKYMTMPKELPKNRTYTALKKKYDSLILRISLEDDPAFKGSLQGELQSVKMQISAYEKQAWDDLKPKVKKAQAFMKSIVAFIGDEVHHASSDTWYELFMKLESARYRFGLTGTVDDSNPINVMKLFGCTGDIIAKVSNQFLIEQGYSAEPMVYMMALPPIDYTMMDYNYQDARYYGIIHNEARNNLFRDRILERAENGKQCLVIVNETEHGDLIYELLEQDLGDKCKFIHGSNTKKVRMEALDSFKAGDLRVLIATSILDEGVDVPSINCLFLMAGGKSPRMLLQRIGRGLRKKADGSCIEVYDSLDYCNEHLIDHTLERFETYKAEGFKVMKLR